MRIDHVIVAATDLDAAAARLEGEHGCSVPRSGRRWRVGQAAAAPENARSNDFGSLHQDGPMAWEFGSGNMSSLVVGEPVEHAGGDLYR